VADLSTTGSTINKEFVFTLKGESELWGKLELTRKYSDFHKLREVLMMHWPGVFIPPIPSKGNIGISESQILKNKKNIIISFINRILDNKVIAESAELRGFLKSPEN
jgi:sorting nexin-1/2